ncbi:MAG TPA: transglutaminase-like domain-containing protein [Tepidisphaeraceae bacterium]
MPITLPTCCSRPAFDLFAKQVNSIETTDGLLRAAIAMAMHQLDGVTVQSVDRTLKGYAKMIASRVRGPQQQAVLAHLHQYLFDELAYAGNNDDYYNPANSYLPEVLASRSGLPITLTLIYKVVAEKLGQEVQGVGLPGHFIAAVATDAGPMYVDCFNGGRILTAGECQEQVERIFADTVEWTDSMLDPVSNRMWVSRMIQNLLHVFTTHQQWNDVAAMIELQMVLWPSQTQLKRDLGLVLARIDMPKPASMWLHDYLRCNPNDPERDELVELVSKLSR